MYNVHIVVAEASQRLVTTSLGDFCVVIMLKRVGSAHVALLMTDTCMYFRTLRLMPCYKVYFCQKIKKAPGKKVAPWRLLGAFAPFSD